MRIRTCVGALAFVSIGVCAQAPVESKLEADPTKTAVTTDQSDLWWNPGESGWGMQLVQESNVIFVTLFIYASDGRPTWATAQLNSIGSLTWSGPLYVTSGPWFGGPFNPSSVGVRQAGTMTFSAPFVQAGTVTYSIDGVTVTKQVQRQTLVFENYSGNYVVGAHAQSSGCYNPSFNGVFANAANVDISHNGTNASISWQFVGGPACGLAGIYEQAGHMGVISGNYSCTSGEVGQMRFFELTNRRGMMAGRLRGGSTNDGCQYTGYFSGVDPNRPPL